MKIGLIVKELRVQHRITLTELSKRTGLTISFLSQLERKLTSPSVDSLEKIAQALHVKISDFFHDGEKKNLIVIRKGAGKQSAGGAEKVLIETLASGVFDINMRSQLFSLGTYAEITDDLSAFQGEKFMMVLKGSVEFFIGKERFVFEEGDSVYCARSQSPDKIVNAGKTESRVLYISVLSS
jgi:transcriptional regulator with XRE-family HTH domain